MWGMVGLIQYLGQLAVVVLHPMTLIYDHVLPRNLKHGNHTYTCTYYSFNIIICACTMHNKYRDTSRLFQPSFLVSVLYTHIPGISCIVNTVTYALVHSYVWVV